MPMVINHDLLFSTDLKYFKSLQIIEGKTIFDRYRSAHSLLEKFDEKYQFFLAYPVREDSNIEFHGIKAKNDDPQVLSELQNEDAAKYQRIKAETIEYYNNKIEELKEIDKDKAEFLSAAIKTVDDRFVYCYDDRVVLGAWGMQIREKLREDITEVRKSVPRKKKKEEKPDEGTPGDKDPKPETPVTPTFNVIFNPGENGKLNGYSFVTKEANSFLGDDEIPQVESKEGYEFTGWSETPNNYQVTGDKEFTAQYRQIPPVAPPLKKLPWWKRFWLWLTALFAGKGCLKWLWRVLLFLLLLLLLLWLLRNCHGCSHHIGGGTALGDNDSTWLNEDPNVGNDGGIYDPRNPYNPKPTPPGYDDVLPPQQGVLPPIDENPEIIPGNPSIIANRLNILMDNENKSILDLAKDFKAKYPEDKYKIVYYDDVVKRMQIEVPKEERERMKQEIPPAFSPEYDLFVFDEALFEGAYKPNDPAFSDSEKSWYLKAIHAPEAWDITRGSEKITVAIVDNGFNLNHPELKSKVVQPYNVWKHSDEIFPQTIDHGTHVAGTALAIADNGKGICGIAPNCKFMPIQVANERDQMTTTSVLDGILYSLYQGADVINVSLGSVFTGLSQAGEDVQMDMINNHFKEEERLWRHVMRIAASHNSTVVIAAGNDNVLAGIDALQRPELFITVSAVDKNNNANKKANFSNYGQFSDISAPGVAIYSTVGSDGYQTMDGTSMAAPIITGTVALMKSLNKNLTNKQIICILQGTGAETQGNIGKLVQIDKALQKVKSGDTVNCTPSPSTGDVQVLLSWSNYNDLDLIVTDPTGASVWYKNRRVSSGGQLEIDMNVEYPDSKSPIENIYWQQGGAPKGTYNVYLLYFKQHESISENPFKIIVKHGEKTDEYKGTIDTEKKVVHICTFTLGVEGSNPQNPDLPNSGDDRRSQLEQERDRLQQELDRVNRELKRIENSR
ncbi:MAG: S8 family serine peptidase [Bacteroidetes bacterium]|nr:S8 family serine peptidase [Bacteroidota bacterium]MBU1718044.1 S8 family serine peptidase [Bacteroidota bacterium]